MYFCFGSFWGDFLCAHSVTLCADLYINYKSLSVLTNKYFKYNRFTISSTSFYRSVAIFQLKGRIQTDLWKMSASCVLLLLLLLVFVLLETVVPYTAPSSPLPQRRQPVSLFAKRKTKFKRTPSAPSSDQPVPPVEAISVGEKSSNTVRSESKLTPLVGTLEERKAKFDEKSPLQRNIDELLAPTPVGICIYIFFHRCDRCNLWIVRLSRAVRNPRSSSWRSRSRGVRWLYSCCSRSSWALRYTHTFHLLSPSVLTADCHECCRFRSEEPPSRSGKWSCLLWQCRICFSSWRPRRRVMISCHQGRVPMSRILFMSEMFYAFILTSQYGQPLPRYCGLRLLCKHTAQHLENLFSFHWQSDKLPCLLMRFLS